MSTNPSPTASREITMSRVFDAPIELVWEAMTNPKHVVNWWGPRGFTDTIEEMEVRPGGVWKHTLHGPDGTNYPNKSVFKEVVKHDRLVFSHGGGREEGPGANFVATWKFETVAPGKTRLTATMVFPTAEMRDFVVREFGAIEGGKQTLERLMEYVPKMTGDFVLTRVFDAPRDLVWKVWTDADHLVKWFGPKGFTTVSCKMDLRPGGMFHYCLRAPNGQEMWGRWIIQEVEAPEKIHIVMAFSDAAGGVHRHPMNPKWPVETRAITTFTEYQGKTTLTLRWSAHNATAEEKQTFDSSHDSMRQGWGGTLEQLTDYLVKAQA